MLALSEAGKTLVIATHDLSLIAEMHAQVALLSEDHRIEKIALLKRSSGTMTCCSR